MTTDARPNREAVNLSAHWPGWPPGPRRPARTERPTLPQPQETVARLHWVLDLREAIRERWSAHFAWIAASPWPRETDDLRRPLALSIPIQTAPGRPKVRPN